MPCCLTNLVNTIVSANLLQHFIAKAASWSDLADPMIDTYHNSIVLHNKSNDHVSYICVRAAPTDYTLLCSSA